MRMNFRSASFAKAIRLEEAEVRLAYAYGELNSHFGEHEGSPDRKLDVELVEMSPLRKEIGCFEQQCYHVDKYGTIVILFQHPLRLYPSVEEDQGKGADIGELGCRLPHDARQWRDTFTASLRPVPFQ